MKYICRARVAFHFQRKVTISLPLQSLCAVDFDLRLVHVDLRSYCCFCILIMYLNSCRVHATELEVQD